MMALVRGCPCACHIVRITHGGLDAELYRVDDVTDAGRDAVCQSVGAVMRTRDDRWKRQPHLVAFPLRNVLRVAAGSDGPTQAGEVPGECGLVVV